MGQATFIARELAMHSRSTRIGRLLWAFFVLLAIANGCNADGEDVEGTEGGITNFYNFNVVMTSVTRLCNTKNIVTVNGQFPGPVIHVNEGERLVVQVTNQIQQNVTIHWHGIFQNRTGWFDGPAYVTQCPIKSGNSYRYSFVIANQRGTLWWHAHIAWLRATVYGALIIHPKPGVPYPFTAPHHELPPIILGEWWNADVQAVLNQALASGGGPNVSDAITINTLPGPLYNCSNNETYVLEVEQRKTYLLRIINAAMNTDLFFAISNHNVTVVEADASYTKPFSTDVVVITPGQTTTVLLTADQAIGDYYMAARAYASNPSVPFDNTTTAAILRYKRTSQSAPVTPTLPNFPAFNDTPTVAAFDSKLRGLPMEGSNGVPLSIDKHLIYTVGLNVQDCPPGAPNSTCQGNGGRFAASINNITYVTPRSSILQSHYTQRSKKVFRKVFSAFPPFRFNYTGPQLQNLNSKNGTKALVLPYGTNVQIILQGTSLVNAESHPMHLHGYDFFVVGQGFGNYHASLESTFNLVDPPLRNTVGVPLLGWAAIRFTANNPGAWFMHCHLDIHTTWGLDTVLIVEDGEGPLQSLEKPPQDYPPC